MAGAGTAAARGLIAFVALAGAVSAQTASVDLSDPIEREWRARELAADIGAHVDELTQHFGSGDAIRRRFAFDVLARGCASDSERSVRRFAVESTLFHSPSDERSDVTAERLRLIAAAFANVEASCEPGSAEGHAPSWIAEMSEHALPTVRTRVVDVLGTKWASVERDDLLTGMVTDEDERVSSAARARLAACVADGTASSELLARAWQAIASAGGLEELADFALALEDARLDASVLDALAASLRLATDDDPSDALWIGVLEALRLRAGAAIDANDFFDAWRIAESELDELSPIFERAAKSARGVRPELGAEAFVRFEADPDGDFASLHRRAAIEALGPREVAKLALASNALDDDARAELFARFHGHAIEWTAAELAPWLDPATRAVEVRAEVVDWLRASVVETPNAEHEAALALALRDPELGVVRSAFLGMCNPESCARRQSEWIAAWERFDAGERIELLGRLPRGVALDAMRERLVAIGNGGGEARAAVLELLTPFAPDRELAATVEGWLRDERTLAERGKLERGDELRIAGIVRALHRIVGDEAVEALDAAAIWSSGRSDEIGKVAIWALGQSEAGRSKLAQWLDEEAPSRLRIEAELMLAPHGDAKAVSFTISDYARGDLELKARAIAALDASNAPRGLEFLSRVAVDDSGDIQLRLRALDVLVRRGPGGVALAASVARASVPDISAPTWVVLGRSGGEAARAVLVERLADVARALADGPRSEQALLLDERGALLRACAAAEIRDEPVRRQWRAELDRRAADDLRERFTDDREPRAEFACGPELEYGRMLARAKALDEALAYDPRWRRWDASVLEALGTAALEEGALETADELLSAAHIALLGEPDGELRAARSVELRRRRLAVCERRALWTSFEHVAESLYDDARARRAPKRAFERAFGGFEPAEGVDGLARLASAIDQARATRSLADGDLEAAREHGARARTRIGRSAAAQAAQARLEQRIEAEAAARR